MSYYCFNRCPENALPKLKKFAKKYSLKETDTDLPVREWAGKMFKRKGWDRLALIVYNPNGKYPLLFQTESAKVSHKQGDVKLALQELIEITTPTEITNFFKPYNLEEFR